MNKSETITAVIPARNEEKNIERCIKSLSWCDNIVVMSMGNDNTAALAKKLGAEVVEKYTSEKNDFIAVQKNINWAIDHSKTDWILRIDADEEVTPELRKEIQQILSQPPPTPSLVKEGHSDSPHFQGGDPPAGGGVVAYGVPRNQYFWGGFLKGGDWSYDRLIRLFRRDLARYDPIVHVHEQLSVKGETAELTHALNHYSHPTLKVAVDKFNTYTSIQINELSDSYINATMKMLFLPPYIFLRWLFWNNGYRDGLRGIVAGGMRAWYEFMLYAKYLESFKK